MDWLLSSHLAFECRKKQTDGRGLFAAEQNKRQKIAKPLQDLHVLTYKQNKFNRNAPCQITRRKSQTGGGGGEGGGIWGCLSD